MRKIESYGSASASSLSSRRETSSAVCVYRDVGVKSRMEQIIARLSAKTEAADDAERALAAANKRVSALQSEVEQLETALANRRAFAMNAIESRHAFARALAASAPMLRRDAAVDEAELVRTMVTHRAVVFAARTRGMLAARTTALALSIPARVVEPEPLAAKPSTDASSAPARFTDDADVAAIVRERDEAREAATRAATATKTCAERMVRYLDAKNKGYLNAKKAEMRAAVDAKEEEARLERERAAERERDLRCQLEREREKTAMLESEREKLEKGRAEREVAEAAEHQRVKKGDYASSRGRREPGAAREEVWSRARRRRWRRSRKRAEGENGRQSETASVAHAPRLKGLTVSSGSIRSRSSSTAAASRDVRAVSDDDQETRDARRMIDWRPQRDKESQPALGGRASHLDVHRDDRAISGSARDKATPCPSCTPDHLTLAVAAAHLEAIHASMKSWDMCPTMPGSQSDRGFAPPILIQVADDRHRDGKSLLRCHQQNRASLTLKLASARAWSSSSSRRGK